MKKLSRLRPKVKLLTDFFVFDTETGEERKGEHGKGIYWHLNARPESFKVGVLYGHNVNKVFYTVESLKLELLKPEYKDKYIFAHNAEYDLNVLYGNIFHLDPKAIFNGKFITATNGNCKFADSMNIFQTSVEKLGKMLGIEKPTLGEVGKMFSKSVDADVINRCSTDCMIVYEALIRIFEDSGDIKITQASLSMTYYRRFHQPYDIEHNDNVKHFWSSYYGGRCEAFKIGKTNAIAIDINSSYPKAMRDAVFPNPKYLRYDVNVDVKNLNHYLDNYEGCIYCTINHVDTWLGYLPYKYEGKLCFPVGEFTGCFNFNELRFSLARNIVRVTRIEKIVFSERMQSPFKDYVDKLYEKRILANSRGDTFENYRIKIFMNSLYGKFAQRILEETIYIKDIDLQWSLIEEYQRLGLFIKLSMFNMERKDAILYVKAVKFKNISYSIPSFASYITSYSRVLLLEKLIELENNIPVYCDTDSIFYEIDSNVVTGLGLGQWKREDKIITEIRGLKNYKFVEEGKEYRKLKGVPNKATKITDNDFEYFNLIKTKESLRRNKVAGVLTKRTKHINNIYEKREVFADGTTKPIKL